MKETILLWIDDLRPAPEGYVHCHSVNETKAKILQCEKEGISIGLLDLDHDAGDYASDGGDFIKILDWMAETGRGFPCRLHTANPVGRNNMMLIIDRNGWEFRY